MMWHKKILILVLLVFSNGVYADDKQEASDVVKAFQTTLLDVMQQGKALNFTQRFEQLKPVIIKSHNLPKMTRIVMSRTWKTLDIAQKKRLIETISTLSIASYAHYFTDYTGESFTLDSVKQVSPTQIYVHTFLVLPEESNVSMNYLLKKKGDKWRIINIITNGVSDLALKRSEYVSVLKKSGFDALVAEISAKIDIYSKQ